MSQNKRVFLRSMRGGALSFLMLWTALFPYQPASAAGDPAPQAVATSAKLTGLQLSAGTLSPGFQAEITDYMAQLPESANEMTVTPVAEEPGAVVSVSINGESPMQVASGSASPVLELEQGSNVIQLKVSSSDGKQSRAYRVTVPKSSVVLQQGAGGYTGTRDAHVSEGSHGAKNTGGHTDIEIGYFDPSVTDRKLGLIRFDLSSIPAGAQVTDASIDLQLTGTRVRSGNPRNDKDIFIHELTSDWEEGTGAGFDGTAGAPGVVWNTRPAYNETVTSVVYGTRVRVGTDAGVWYSWPITALAQRWLHQALPNYGVVLKEADSTSNATTLTSTKDFASAQNARPEARPKLKLAYKLPLTGLKLDTRQLELREGETHQVTSFLRPLNADTRAVQWTSSNPAVAAVDASGRITAVGAGNAEVKAVTGGYEAVVQVKVTRVSIKGSLTGLTLKGAKLDPVFASDQLAYTASVPYNARKVVIEPIAAEANAKITVQRGTGEPEVVASGGKSHPIALEAGRAELKIKVESVEPAAPGEPTSKEYTVNVQYRTLGGEADAIISNFLNAKGKPMAIAHRGNWLNGKPENGLDSIRESIAEGLDMVELDIRNTRDGVPVLMHDDSIDRTTNGSGSVSSLTLAQIKSYCLKKADGSVSNPCEKVPTLEEAMQVARSHIMVNLDNKSSFDVQNLNKMWDILVRTDTTDHALYKSNESFKPMITDFMNQFADSAAEPFYMLLSTTQRGVNDYLDPQKALFRTVAFELSFSNDNDPVMDPAFLASVHDREARVWVNTIYSVPGLVGRHGDYAFLTDPDAGFPWLLARGVDMFQTDTTTLLLNFLKSRQGGSTPVITQTMTFQDGLNGYTGTADTSIAEMTRGNINTHNFGGVAQLNVGPIDPVLELLKGNVTSRISSVQVTGSSPDAEQKGNLLDASPITKWLTFENKGTVTMSLQAPTVVKKYAITSANDDPSRDPRVWTFEGTMDGSSWDVLDTRTDENFTDRYQTRVFTISNTQAYSQYRLKITATGNAAGGYLQIAELQLSDGSDTPAPTLNADRRYGLVQFDLSPLPAGAKVEQAKLELYRVGSSRVSSPTEMKLHQVTQAWTEGLGSGTNGSSVPDGQSWVTWTNRPAFESGAASTQELDASTFGWLAMDMTSLVKKWREGSAPNYGVLLDAGTRMAGFASSENAVQLWRPKLTVTYTVPVAAIDIQPQSLTIKAGESAKLTASLKPDDAMNRALVWSSADGTVASVLADGTITGLRKGSTSIIVRTVDGGYEARAMVTVMPSGDHANLTGIMLSSGQLTEPFDKAKVQYTAEVSEALNQIQVTPIAEDEDSAITLSVNYGGEQPVRSGQSSSPIKLELGDNRLVFKVKSPLGTEERTYNVTVPKKAIVLQQGAGGYTGVTDTQLSRGTGGQGNKYYQYNLGAQHSMEIGYYNQNVTDEKYGLIRFGDLPVPAGAIVKEASLNLYHFGSRGSNADRVNEVKELFVHQARAPWVEGRGGSSTSNDGSPAEPGEVTWENYITNQPNTFEPDASSSRIVKQSPEWNSFDLSALVQNWVNSPTSNYGVLLKRKTYADTSDASMIGTKQFRTSDYSVTEQRPYLRIVYEMPLAGIRLDRTELKLMLGGSGETLHAQVLPLNAADQSVVWASQDESVAVVDPQGRVTPTGIGTTVITAANAQGTKASAAVTVQKLGTQADLSGLSVTGGKLMPAFSPTHYAYTLAVPYSADSVTMTPVAEDAQARLTIRKAGEPPRSLQSGKPSEPLTVGDSPEWVLQVVSEDGQTTHEYTIKTVRTFGLSQLAVSTGTMTPAFASDVLQYVIEVTAETTQLSLQAETLDPQSLLNMAQGSSPAVPLENGKDSGPIALQEGANPVSLQIKTPDGALSRTYTLTIYRKPKPVVTGGGSGSGSSGSSSAPAQPEVIKLGDELSVQRPAGEADLKLKLEKLGERAGDQERPALSPVYAISKEQAGRLGQPLTLTFAFDASAGKEGRPSVFRYDASASRWIELGGEVHDGKITVASTEVGKFVVLAVPAPSTSTGPVGTQPPVKSWSDVQSHWAKEAIEIAAARGIVDGYADGTMKPDVTVTRAQFAVMLTRALGLKGEASALTFQDRQDVPVWAAGPIGLAVQAGILSGYEDGTVRPDREISRAEMAVMLLKAYGVDVSSSAGGGFQDEGQIPDWAKPFVAEAAQRSILQGYEDGEFKPGHSATRAEALQALFRTMNVSVKP